MRKVKRYQNIFLIILTIGMLVACGSGETPSKTTITGTVFDADNNPIEGAEVTILSNPVTTTTDRKGAFSVEVGVGNYEIFIRKGSEIIYYENITTDSVTSLPMGAINTSHDPYGTGRDDDGDSYTESRGDCDDSNAEINPGVAEICDDGIDQDCSGSDLICANMRKLISSITFNDAILETCVINAGVTYIDQLSSLVCRFSTITNLTGIAELTNLTNLDLSYNNISDVTPLASMASLADLDLSHNSINDVSPLASLTSLSILHLNYNSINNVSPLDSLTGLTWLYLSDNSINNVSSLASLTILSILDLGNNNINDVSPLASLTNLVGLSLRDNSIDNISFLASMIGLTHLYLSHNSINDISPLVSMTNLEVLDLRFNKIINVSPVASLTGLGGLDLSYNSINDVSSLASLTSLTWLHLSYNFITTGILNFVSMTNAYSIYLDGNNNISCTDLTTLTHALGSKVVKEPSSCL